MRTSHNLLSIPSTILTIGDREVRRDASGYLVNPEEWDEDVAEAIAEEEGIQLTEQHWAVLQFMRQYLDQYGIAAEAEYAYDCLARHQGQPMATAREQYFHLFPYGHIKQTCKIAGVPLGRARTAG